MILCLITMNSLFGFLPTILVVPFLTLTSILTQLLLRVTFAAPNPLKVRITNITDLLCLYKIPKVIQQLQPLKVLTRLSFVARVLWEYKIWICLRKWLDCHHPIILISSFMFVKSYLQMYLLFKINMR